MNAGEVATRLGLPGVHKAAETIVLERDVRLVEITGGRYHAATISCAESLAVVRAAKARKLPVTCGVSINHLTLNENDIGPYRTFFRLRPPLRARGRPPAMVRGLAAGEIDVIVSSHDPQDADTKRHPFAEAADGAIGLETLLAAALRLHHNGEIGLLPLLQGHDHQSSQAARAARRPPRKGRAGRPDPGRPRPAVGGGQGGSSQSRSKNSPFDESKMQGRVLATMVAGNTVYQYAARRARLSRVAVPERWSWALSSRPTAAGAARRLSAGLIPFGLLLTKAAGLGDVRNIGSGNIGATNVLRTGHKGLAAATLLLDALKGTVAVLLVYEIARGWVGFDAFQLATSPGSAPFSATSIPVWLRFQGGKGVATYIGVLIGVHWPAAICVRPGLDRRGARHALFLAGRAVRRRLAVVLYYLVTGWAGLPFILIMSALIFLKHHANIRRLLEGEESKIGARS